MIDPETYQWAEFEIVFYYNNPLDQVFKSWTTGAGLESFFIKSARFTGDDGIERLPSQIVKNRDRYRWEWHHPFVVEGRVENVETNHEFSFTFGEMNVTTSFVEIDDQTELHLVQSNIPETSEGRVYGHLNCRSCWIFFLTNLKSVLESGLDLRDTNPDRVSSMEVGFIPLSKSSIVDK